MPGLAARVTSVTAIGGVFAAVGWPATALLAALAALLLLSLLWVIGSQARTTRLVRLIHAVRGRDEPTSRR